ncbi:hypothetical protein AB0I16_16135 [Streptomyces sp. NPDC050703]|uniref:hypothetical protein n=1 Tax=Streptomyces sp. NPDC050703 TaxID=3157218 RepID=UPI0034327866
MGVVLRIFGIAHLPVDDGPALTSTGVPVGTPRSTSPEAPTAARPGPPAGVYGVGVCLYAMC